MIHTDTYNRKLENLEEEWPRDFAVLLDQYQLNALKLFSLGQMDCKLENTEAVQNESELLYAQEAILETAAVTPLEDLSSFKALFELWYQSVVKETRPENLNLSDKLVLSLYKNLSLVA